MPAAIVATPAAKVPCGRYNAYTATPTNVHTARYDPTKSGTAWTRPLASARLKTAGAAPGSIIAAIIVTHRGTKNANEPSSVAPPMSIPFICRTATTQDAAASPRVAASAAAVAAALALVMAGRRRVRPALIEQLVADRPQATVRHAGPSDARGRIVSGSCSSGSSGSQPSPHHGLTAAAGSSAPPSERVLVLAPAARLLRLRLRRPLEQHTEVGSDERIGGHYRVGVVDGPVLAGERDVARGLAEAVLELRPNLLRPFLEPARRVVDHLLDLGDLLCLLFGQSEPEVEREVGPVRRHVGELPAHPLLVGSQTVDRCPREAEERDVALVQVDQLAIEPVCEARASGTGPDLVIRPVHDVVREELRAAIEQIGESPLPGVGVELVLLLDRDPGELEPLPLDLLVSLGVFRLELGQLVACRLPLVARSNLVPSHLVSLL